MGLRLRKTPGKSSLLFCEPRWAPAMKSFGLAQRQRAIGGGSPCPRKPPHACLPAACLPLPQADGQWVKTAPIRRFCCPGGLPRPWASHWTCPAAWTWKPRAPDPCPVIEKLPAVSNSRAHGEWVSAETGPGYEYGHASLTWTDAAFVCPDGRTTKKTRKMSCDASSCAAFCPISPEDPTRED